MPSYVRAGIRKCARIRALSANCPADIRRQSICINADIGDVLARLR